MLKKCMGCGSILQTEFEDKAGYIPEITKNKDLFCKRCFRLKHYSELPKIIASNLDYEKVIDNVLSKNGLMILIVDLFDFSGSFTKTIVDKLRGKDVILVANKYDLFPKSTNVTKIVDWLSKSCEKVFFRVLGIHIVSSTKGYYLDELMNTIDLARKSRDVYFVGCANVGKSSLINQLLKKFNAKTEDLIATSVIPGTTLDQIVIPFFEDNKAFIDTPGLINEGNIINKLLPKSYKMILPNGEINPITYQITKNNCIFVGGIVCVDFTEVINNVSLTCYFSKSLTIHRTKSEKIPHFFKEHIGTLLTPPSVEEKDNIKYTIHNFEFDGKIKKDIVFSGLGFITVSGSGKFMVHTFEGTDVFVRNAIIGR